MQEAACARVGDRDLFIDDDGVAEAKRICRECPVIQACLLHAMCVGEPAGVWGGLTGAERRIVMRKGLPVDLAIENARASDRGSGHADDDLPGLRARVQR